MSSAANIKNTAARVAVKVPFPDSLVEVRMSPPESNFEVKVTPGGEVIELLIHPGCSQIEVRITQPGNQDEERSAPPEEEQSPQEPKPESPAGAAQASEAKVQTTPVSEAKAAPSVEPAPAEEEVVPGVSRAEFAAMAEEDAADEAKKLLAEMGLHSPHPTEEAEPPLDYELPAEIRKLLEDGEPAEDAPTARAPFAETGPITTAAPPQDLETPALEDPDTFLNETGTMSPAAKSETPEESRPMGLEIEPRTEEMMKANPAEEVADIAAGSSDIFGIEVENFSASFIGRLDQEPDAVGESRPKPAPEKSAARVELEYPSSLVMEDDLGGDSSTAKIPEAVEEAARQALARLSAATYEERGGLELERISSPPAQKYDAAPNTRLPEQLVDRTIMVEYIEDTGIGPQHLPDDTTTPLPEEDQMDLGPVEMEEEELAIEPIDLGDMELDLEKSRAASSADSQTVLKAKPMVTALPNNTIVPH